jgi:hypothetical protein
VVRYTPIRPKNVPEAQLYVPEFVDEKDCKVHDGKLMYHIISGHGDDWWLDLEEEEGSTCSPSHGPTPSQGIPNEKESCSNCVFMFEKTYANFCLRYPPVWAGDNWAFPVMDADDWCGEWEEKV